MWLPHVRAVMEDTGKGTVRRPEPGGCHPEVEEQFHPRPVGPCGLPATSLPTPTGVAPACPRPLACDCLSIVPQMKPEQVERSHSSSEGLQNLILLINVAWRQECPDRSQCHGLPVRCSLWSKKSQGRDPPCLLSPPGSSLCPPSWLSASSLCAWGLCVPFHLLKSARLCEGEVGAEAPACR